MSFLCWFGLHRWSKVPDWYDGATRAVFECRRGCRALDRRDPVVDWAVVRHQADLVTQLSVNLALPERQRTRVRRAAWLLRSVAYDLREHGEPPSEGVD